MKKKKNSNDNLIFYLLVLALIITVIGTGMGIFRVGGGNLLLTGAATAVGTTSVTVTATTSLTNQVSQVNFGSGYVNATATYCNLISNGSSFNFTTTCVSFNNVTQGFLLENTGNTNVSLNWSCSDNCTAAQLLGGTSPGFQIRNMPAFQAFNQTGQSGSNDTATSCNATINLRNNTFGDVRLGGEFICGNVSVYTFEPTNSKDAIIVDFNLTVPEDALTGRGQENATFTFTATASG